MSRSVGGSLSPELRERLSQRALSTRAGTAIPLITVDTHGRPHPMLVSYVELRAYDASTVGLVIRAGSGSAHNLARAAVATIALIEPDLVAYIKLRRVDGPLAVVEDERLAYFLLEVEDVREDTSPPEEAGARIVSSLRYEPVDLASAWARATLAALAQPRARA
jgi:hypothetical protein